MSKQAKEVKEMERFLKHVDRVLRVTKKIYDLGESCAVHFNVESGGYEISESIRDKLEAEIKKRDVGTPEITWYHGHLAYVIIQNPYG
jgi:hypothetical protein